MPTNKRILIAVDWSGASRRAVAYTADTLGPAANVHVGLLHLKLPPRMLEWGGSEDVEVEDKISSERARHYQGLEKSALKEGEDRLKNMQIMLTEKNIDVAALLVEFEEPLDPKHITSHLLKTAAERDYDTVVVGRNSFSGLRHFFGHPVGEELVRAARGITIWVVE